MVRQVTQTTIGDQNQAKETSTTQQGPGTNVQVTPASDVQVESAAPATGGNQLASESAAPAASQASPVAQTSSPGSQAQQSQASSTAASRFNIIRPEEVAASNRTDSGLVAPTVSDTAQTSSASATSAPTESNTLADLNIQPAGKGSNRDAQTFDELFSKKGFMNNYLFNKGQAKQAAVRAKEAEKQVDVTAKAAEEQNIQEGQEASTASEEEFAKRFEEKNTFPEPKKPANISQTIETASTNVSRKQSSSDLEQWISKTYPKNELGNKNRNGLAYYLKLVGNTGLEGPQLAFDQVGLGKGALEACLRNIPPEFNETVIFFNKILEKYGEVLSNDVSTAIAQIQDVCRREDVWIALFKSPDLQPQSSCQKRLVILDDHYSPSIMMHPLALKKFNADTDGDEGSLSFDTSAIKLAANADDYLIDLGGDLMVDPDFFPRYHPNGGLINEVHREKALNAIKANVADDASFAEALNDLYFAIPNAREDATRKFLKELDRCAKERGVTSSDLLTASYNTLHTLSIGQAADNSTITLLRSDLPTAKTTNDRKLYQFTEELLDEVVVKAKGAKNHQDLRVMMHEHFGEPKGTNPSFRFTAAVAKLFVNVDSRIHIGSQVDVPMEELLDGVLHFVEARKISEALTLDERAKDLKTIFRTRIIKMVGMPSKYKDSLEFLDRFARVYSTEAAFIEASDYTLSTNFKAMLPNEKTTNVIPLKDYSYHEVAKALRDVYGDNLGMSDLIGDTRTKMVVAYRKTQGSLRKSDEITIDLNVVNTKYGRNTVDEYVRFNKTSISDADYETAESESLFTQNPETGELVIRPQALHGIVMALGHARTSSASDFNKKVYGSPNDIKKSNINTIAKALIAINEYQTNRSGQDLVMFANYLEQMVSVIVASNKDVYSYFGMDSFDSFVKSGYGKAMLKAAKENDLDKLASIRMAMVYEYRMSATNEASTRLSEVYSNLRADSKDLAFAVNDLVSEHELLASSSWTWKALIRDKEERTYQAFERLTDPNFKTTFEQWRDGEFRNFNRNEKGVSKTRVLDINGLSLIPNFKLWEESWIKEYNSLEEVMLDINLSSQYKKDILSDVVRSLEHLVYFKSYEIPIQLEMDTHAAYSTLKPESESLMKATKDSNRMWDKIKNGNKRIEDDIAETLVSIESNPSLLRDAIKRSVENQYSYISYTPDIVADSMVAAVADKTYHQTEKNQQHPASSALFAAASYARNFVYTSDVYRTMDRAFGIMPQETVSSYDIIRVLNGETIYVENRRGEVVELSLNTMIGNSNPTDQELLDFLIENPNIFACLRYHTVSVTTDGRAFVGAVGTIKQFIENDSPFSKQDEVLPKLYDDPDFAAIIGLLTPTWGKVSRDLRTDYQYNIKSFFAYLTWSYNIAKPENPDAVDNLCTAMIVDLGVDSKSLEALGIVESEAVKLEKLIKEALTRFCNLCESDFQKLGLAGYTKQNMKDMKSYFKPDLSSAQAYYDIRQELTGAKTNISTGVEGTESWRLAAWISALWTKDNYVDAGSVDTTTLQEQFGDCMTSLGKTISEFTPEDFELLEETDDIVVEAPKGFAVPDKSLGNGKQTSAVCAYLIIKRDKGAEEFNLKAKKTGDDGLHSISKYSKFYDSDNFKNYQEIVDILNGIYNPEDPATMMDVKSWIARRLYDADRLCRYDNLTMADATNISDLLVRFDPETGTVNLRTLYMIASAIRDRITYQTIESGDRNLIHDAAVSFSELAGRRSYDVAEIIACIRVRPPALPGSSLANLRASSWTRNYGLLRQIGKEALKNGYGSLANKKKDEISFEPDSKEGQRLVSFYRNIAREGADKAFLAGFTGYDKDIRPLCYGPQAIWYIMGEPTVEQLGFAYSRGLTVVCEKPVMHSVPVQGTFLQIVPTFDMRLNDTSGYSVASTELSQFGVFRRPADNIVWGAELKVNPHSLTDAGIQLYRSLVDRLNVDMPGQTQMQVSKFFPNVFYSFPKNNSMQISLANKDDIVDLLNPEKQKTIDYGVIPPAATHGKKRKAFDKHCAEVMRSMDRWLERFNNRDNEWLEGGLILKDNKPGDTIGWLKCSWVGENGENYKAYAPIIPFDITGRNGVSRAEVPSQFELTMADLQFDGVPTQSTLTLNWRFTDDLENHIIKFFEGGMTANKLMADVKSAVESLMTKGGIPLDYSVAPETTANRRVGTNARLDTLETLMVEARTRGYNFARLEGAFPEGLMLNEQESIKDRMLNGYVRMQEWKDLGVLDNPHAIRWHEDAKIDAFVVSSVEKFTMIGANPTDFLCSVFGKDQYTDIWWDFKATLKPDLVYQDSLMYFLHAMDSELCAASVNDHSENYIYRCAPQNEANEFDSYCMEKGVYIPDGDDNFFLDWARVQARFSFFNMNDFSGAHPVNYNGFAKALDAVITQSLAHNDNVSTKDFVVAMKAAMSEYGRPITGIGLEDPLQSNIEGTSIAQSHPAEGERISKYDAPMLNPEWKGKTLALTGHRPKDLPSNIDYAKVKQELIDYCHDNDIDTVISGMALGFDQVGALAVIESLQKEGIKLVAAVPFEGQEKKWNDQQQKTFERIIEKADYITYVSDGGYSNEKYQVRNEWMIDNADEVFALWNGKKGGTGNAVAYAKNIDKPLYVLNPNAPVQQAKPAPKQQAQPKNNTVPTIKANEVANPTGLPDDMFLGTTTDYNEDEAVSVNTTGLPDDMFLGVTTDYSDEEIVQPIDINEGIVVPESDAVSVEKKEPITFDPADDGKTHVNMYSKAKTEIGRVLSNFWEIPGEGITIDISEGLDVIEESFKTVEGYWHFLSFGGQYREDEQVMSLAKLNGPEARKLGRKLKKRYPRKYMSEKEFENEIRFAIGYKLHYIRRLYKDGKQPTAYKTLKEFNKMLEIAAHKPLVHYYIKNDSNGNEVATNVETDSTFVRAAKEAIMLYIRQEAILNSDEE